MRKVTKQEYERFTEQCDSWIEKFGLGDWEVIYELKELGGHMAETVPDKNTSQAFIRLNDTWQPSYKVGDIDTVALHEVCHVLLSDLTIPMYFHVNTDRLGETEHRVINRLIRAFNLTS